MAQPISMYGRETCEDTVLARDRLRRYGVPVAAFDVEADVEAARRVEAWNGGSRVTPTFDVQGRIVAEPALDELDTLLRAAGYEFTPPQPHAAAPDHGQAPAALPDRSVATAAGAVVGPATLAGRPTVLFFAHGPDCLACRGYARALLKTVEPAFAVLSDGPETAERWLHGEAELPADRVLVDEAGEWRAAIERRTGIPRDRTFAIFVAPGGVVTQVTEAEEAGGLAAPTVAADWATGSPRTAGSSAHGSPAASSAPGSPPAEGILRPAP